MSDPRSEQDLNYEVAALLQAREFGKITIGADVDGFEIDILVETGRGRGRRAIVIECKAYVRLAGSATVHSFGSVYQYLNETGRANEGWIISSSGFTPGARLEAERIGLQLFSLTDLRQKLDAVDLDVSTQISFVRGGGNRASHGKKRVFVVMPFSPAMDDVYVLGIRWVAQSLGLVAHRVDDLQYQGDIVAEIQRCIREYDAVVGDTTGGNANVCYEVGFAHALNRPTVLICRAGEDLPFDLRGVNHIMYKNVVQLRDSLRKRLKALLTP